MDLTKRGEYPQILPQIDYYALNEGNVWWVRVQTPDKCLHRALLLCSLVGRFESPETNHTLSSTTSLAIDTRAVNRMLEPN